MEYQELKEAIIYGLMGKGIFISPDAYPIIEREIRRFYYRIKQLIEEDNRYIYGETRLLIPKKEKLRSDFRRNSYKNFCRKNNIRAVSNKI